jgi:hypothetical protein
MHYVCIEYYPDSMLEVDNIILGIN